MFLGKKVWELGFFKDVIANAANFAELQTKEYIRYEDMALEGHDGKRHEVEFVSNVYLVNDKKVIQCNIRDISDRVRSAAALRASEAMFKAVAELSPMAIYASKGSDQKAAFANDAFRKIFGFSLEDVPTVGHWWIKAFPDEKYRQQVIEQWTYNIEQANKNHTDVVALECVCLCKDGSKKNIVWVGKTIGDEFWAFGYDLTERKRAEAALAASSLDLQHKNAELERFFYTASHDLKSPVVTVRTFLGYLEQDLATANAGKIAQDLNFIRAAADKMAQLLDDLLEISRIGRVVAPPVRVTFRQLVDEAQTAVAGRLAARGVRVTVGAGEVVLLGDRLRLAEVLQNLMENACKFMGDQAAPLIEIGFEARATETVFFVRDNGIGIDPRHQAKLFGLFEKIDSQAEGSGIGLAIVKRIVELNGGRIWVESAGLGQGAGFYFTLPAAVNQPTKEKNYER